MSIRIRAIGKLCMGGFAIPYVVLGTAVIGEEVIGVVIPLARETVGGAFLIGLLIGTIGVCALDRSLATKGLVWLLCIAVTILSMIPFAILIAYFFGFEGT